MWSWHTLTHPRAWLLPLGLHNITAVKWLLPTEKDADGGRTITRHLWVPSPSFWLQLPASTFSPPHSKSWKSTRCASPPCILKLQPTRSNKHLILSEKVVYLLMALACVQTFSNNLLCHTRASAFRLVASFQNMCFSWCCFVLCHHLRAQGRLYSSTEAARREQCADKQTLTCMQAGTLLHSSHSLH